MILRENLYIDLFPADFMTIVERLFESFLPTL